MQLLPLQTRPPHSGTATAAAVGLQQLPDWQPPLQQTSARRQSAFVVQLWQEFARHSRPAPHSESRQQVPLTQAPSQHFWPAAHCESELHEPQKPEGLQTVPGAQSALEQQSPDLQLPPQHFPPGPHSESAAQEVQRLLVHTWPSLQSLDEQHCPLAMQAPRQHSELAPQSPLLLQVEQELAWQT